MWIVALGDTLMSTGMVWGRSHGDHLSFEQFALGAPPSDEGAGLHTPVVTAPATAARSARAAPIHLRRECATVRDRAIS